MTDVCGNPSTAVPLDAFPDLQEPAQSSQICWRRRRGGRGGAEGQQSKVNRTSRLGRVWYMWYMWAVVEVQYSEGTAFSGLPNANRESRPI